MLLCFLVATVGGNLLLYSPGFEGLADYSKKMASVMQGTEMRVAPDSVDVSRESFTNIYFYGTPSSRYYTRHWRDRLPVRFHGDTLRLGDSTLVGHDFVFSCHIVQDDGRTVELAVARNVGAAVGMTDVFGHDFVVSRARDGVMYERDLTCYGRLTSVGDSFAATDVVWQPHDRTPLQTIRNGHIVLNYEPALLSDAEAARFARLALVEYQGYDSVLAVRMPDTVHVYLHTTDAPPRAFTWYSLPHTIWCGVKDREALLRPAHNPVLSLAHEFARISLQPLSHEYPQSLGADDWSHYAPMAVIMPEVERVLGETAWIAPFDYRSGGLEKFLKMYKGGERTYAWILYEVGREHGTGLIGEAVRRAVSDPSWRHPEMTAFMDTLGSLTGDTAIQAGISRAFPTPFEISFCRRMGWRETGMSPTLDRMFTESRFVVDSISVGSFADSIGFRAGDSITAIDGVSTDTLKDICKRNLLHKKKGTEVIYSVRRAGAIVGLRGRAE